MKPNYRSIAQARQVKKSQGNASTITLSNYKPSPKPKE